MSSQNPSEKPSLNTNSGFDVIDFRQMAAGALPGQAARAEGIPAGSSPDALSPDSSTYPDDDTTKIDLGLPPVPVDEAGKPVTANVDPYSTPSPSRTPEVSKTSGGLSITGYSARKFSDRKSATAKGAEELWEERQIALESKDASHAAQADENKKLDGFGHDEFIDAAQKSQVATFRARKSNSVVMARGYGINGGEVAAKVAKSIVDASEAIGEGRTRTDAAWDVSRDMVEALGHAKREASSSAKDHNSSASVVAVKVLPDCITVGAAGTISVLMKAKGGTSYLYPEGISKDNSQVIITPQGDPRYHAKDLFSEDAEPRAVTFATGGSAVRMVMATDSRALRYIMGKHAEAFDEAFSQEKAADATAALQKLYRDNVSPHQDADISVMIVDIAPEGADPIAVPSSEANKPKANPAETPKPEAKPEPTPVVAPANAPTGNRRLDALDLLTKIRLGDAARGASVDPDLLLGDSTESQAFREAINQRYQAAFNTFVDYVARRSNALIAATDILGKKFDAASHDFFEALSDRHNVNAIMLETMLRKTNPNLSDQERDTMIKQHIDLSMLGGNTHNWLQPGASTGNQEGIISELRHAIHNRSLELAGWKRDTSGSVTAPEGYRKYVHIFTNKMAEFTNKGVDRWAEWGTQGAKGVAKRVGVGILAGVTTSAVAAAAAPAGAAGSVLASGLAATRVGKALVTTKLNKSAKTINAAESVRAQRIEELRDLYTKGGSIALKDQLAREVERAQIKNLLRTSIAATVPVLGAFGIEHFFSENMHLPNAAAAGHQGLDAGHAPAIGHSSSARLSGSSAPATGHSSAGVQTSAKPSASASARPATGTPSRPSTSGATPTPDHVHGGRVLDNNDSSNGTQQSANLRGGGRPLQSSDAGNHTPTQGGGVTNNHAPAPAAPEGSHTIELSVHNNDQTVWDVVNHAGNGSNLSQGQKWQMVLDSVKSAQAAGQLHTFYQPDGTYFYHALVNGHWTDNTTDVIKTLSKFSKGKFALAA